MSGKKQYTVKKLTQQLDEMFNIDEDIKLSIDERYENLKNKFAELCDITANIQEYRIKYIEKLSSLHVDYMATNNEDQQEEDNTNNPDVDSELENQNHLKSVPILEAKSKSKKRQKVKEIENNSELTEIEPEPELVAHVVEEKHTLDNMLPTNEVEQTKLPEPLPKKSKRKSTRRKTEKTKSAKSKKKKVKKEKEKDTE